MEVNNVTSGFMQTGAQQGWQCPVCKRVLSPWTIECPCRGQGMETFTTTGYDDNAKEYKLVPHQDSTTDGSVTYTMTKNANVIESNTIEAKTLKSKKTKLNRGE